MHTRQTFSKVVFVSFTLSILFFLIGVNGYGVIQISSLDDLKNIGNDASYPLDGEYELTQDIDASDTINWNGGEGFAPIGNNTNRFTGVFDGKGHKIVNLYIYRPRGEYVGLFGCVGSGGQVKNVGLENVQVVGTWYVSSLVGENWEGIVTQSHSTGLVAGNYWNVGGLVGDNHYGTVTQSYSMCFVGGENYVGGLVGTNDGGTVNQSYSMGAVFASTDSSYVGGLVGKNTGTISQSYSMGLVAGNYTVGGLVGWNDSTVIQSYWDINTSGQSSSAGGEGKTTAQMKQQATYVGWDFTTVWDIEENVTYPYLRALGQPVPPPAVVEKEIWSLSVLNKIGRDWEYPMDGHYTLMVDIDASDTINWDGGKGFKPIILLGRFDGNGHVIRNLYINRPEEDEVGLFGRVYGEVLNIGIENAQVSGVEDVGALVGSNGGTVTQSYSTGSVLSNREAGGLVGENRGTLSQSYSTCSVSGNQQVGGLVGYNYNGTVSQSYSMGSIESVWEVGGLVGYNFGTVTQSYSTGGVSGDWDIGGLIGNNNGTIMQSYWDKETSGQSTSAGGTGKTTAEMKQQATYVDWDFVNVWGIVENITYPYLKWQYQVPDVVGMSQSSAESAITGAGLTVGTVTEQCSNTVSAGNVISQTPTAGTQVSLGTSVYLVVSTGPCPEGEGILEGTQEGVVEGTQEGTPEGVVEGTPEGTPEGILEGVIEGTPEGTPEGTQEGVVEGTPEGVPEGVVEGEGIFEGEGGWEKPPHSADQDGDWKISLSELLRVIQFFNMGGYHPCPDGEDGYCPGIIK